MVVDIRTWVKNVANQPPSVTSNDIIVPLSTPTMSAKAVLISRPNSHPFQERTLLLDQPVKVGRSVARARATPTNAIFDCKVLSRHHALLWYENGKFYLQDTKSSNGTFVNNHRLSAGGVESVPHEVCSGDIVQFGVDVVENNRKVTHGCIVATLKLYLHDGKEAKASHSLVGSTTGSVPMDELYKLNQYLQDALQREQLLESKLSNLHSLVEQAREATNLSWQAFIGEDRLLSRVEILESQLLAYSKNYSDDKIREELVRLQEDKNSYQNSAKESLRKLHQERLDAISKLTALQQTLATTEQELAVCKEQRNKAQDDLQELAQRYSTNQEREAELTSKLSAAEEREQDTEQKIQDLVHKIELQKDSLEELHKQTEKAQQDKTVLVTLIKDLNKCTVNNCPVELKFSVDKIINESLMEDIKNTNIKTDDDEDDTDHVFGVDNHKENNVPFYNQTENNKIKEECPETMNCKEIEDLLSKLQDDLKQLEDSTEENDNKSQDIDNLREQISHWTTRFEEQSSLFSQKESSVTLVSDSLDNSQFVKSLDISELRQKLHTAQNDILEKSIIITKKSDEIEHLLKTSALVNSKINLLENDLEEEKENCQKYKKEVEKLKQELQHLLSCNSNEELLLKAKLENLNSELNRRPSVESYEDIKLKCHNLEKICSKLKITDAGDTEIDVKYNMNGYDCMIDTDKDRFTELEEELVVMKEKYAECNVEKLVLNKNLDALQKEYNILVNRSHNIMFVYMAPLILLVAYLLLSSYFS